KFIGTGCGRIGGPTAYVRIRFQQGGADGPLAPRFARRLVFSLVRGKDSPVDMSARRKAAPACTCLLAALLAASCGGGSGDARQGRWNNDENRIPAVEAVEVVLGTLPLEERLAGSVRARNQTEIYPEVTGQIVEVLANDGDRVEAGDPLVR